MRQFIRSQHFALVELILVVLCGAVWMTKPEWGIWFILIALLPLVSRIIFAKTALWHIGAMDWLVFVFLITAWSGYWAAYDKSVAWNKAWLIVTAVLLYYSLSRQPRENLTEVSTLFFCIGVGVALYYFLTHDFITLPRKLEFVNSIGRWIMSVRPQTGWIPIHPNYVAGMIAVTVPFILYPVWNLQKNNRRISPILYTVVIACIGLASIALFMATSRGVILAIFSGAGAWILWRLISLDEIRRRIKNDAVFPILIMIYLVVVITFLYVGPARSGGSITSDYHFGNGSRAELFGRSLYLLFSYPITGGGLGSFPGLYSHYLLGIPFFNVPNSHNLFLDVGIEQGMFGGFSFLLLYFASVWVVSSSIVKEQGNVTFKWIVLFSLIVAIVHGMVDDYLYNGVGSMLSLFLVGLSMNGESDHVSIRSRLDVRSFGIIIAVWVLIILVNFNQIRAVWYANLGAVQLAKVELNGFPNAGWAGYDIVPNLDMADSSLHSSLRFDPASRSANQRFGLILMLRRDFVGASGFLEKARAQAPGHRGIIKSLGYCYVWLGDIDKAQKLLSQIPEAQDELDVYIKWWEAQGRNDLSNNALLALNSLHLPPPQP